MSLSERSCDSSGRSPRAVIPGPELSAVAAGYRSPRPHYPPTTGLILAGLSTPAPVEIGAQYFSGSGPFGPRPSWLSLAQASLSSMDTDELNRAGWGLQTTVPGGQGQSERAAPPRTASITDGPGLSGQRCTRGKPILAGSPAWRPWSISARSVMGDAFGATSFICLRWGRYLQGGLCPKSALPATPHTAPCSSPGSSHELAPPNTGLPVSFQACAGPASQPGP